MADRPHAPAGAATGGSAETGEPVDRRVTEPASRMRAARDLSLRAAGLLDSHRPDAAIDLLEQAIAIDPSNGEAYYHLSRAWLMKGDNEQAAEFNRLAEIYSGDDENRQQKVMEQKARVQYRVVEQEQEK